MHDSCQKSLHRSNSSRTAQSTNRFHRLYCVYCIKKGYSFWSLWNSEINPTHDFAIGTHSVLLALGAGTKSMSNASRRFQIDGNQADGSVWRSKSADTSAMHQFCSTIEYGKYSIPKIADPVSAIPLFAHIGCYFERAHHRRDEW